MKSNEQILNSINEQLRKVAMLTDLYTILYDIQSKEVDTSSVAVSLLEFIKIHDLDNLTFKMSKRDYIEAMKEEIAQKRVPIGY